MCAAPLAEVPPDPLAPKSPAGLLPPVWFLFALFAIVGLARFVPVAWIAPWPWNLSGLVLVVAGFCCALAGNLQFRRHQTSVIPFTRSSALVTDGIFRYTRNPMYLGFVLTLAGAAIGMQALSPLAVVVAFAAFLDVFFIRKEEAWMGMQFGDRYEAYRRQVRRWI